MWTRKSFVHRFDGWEALPDGLDGGPIGWRWTGVLLDKGVLLDDGGLTRRRRSYWMTGVLLDDGGPT